MTSSGQQAVGGPEFTPRTGSYAPILSRDGRYVLFLSLATNLVARRRQRARGHLRARPRRRRRRPVRRARSDRDPAPVGTERWQRGDLSRRRRPRPVPRPASRRRSAPTAATSSSAASSSSMRPTSMVSPTSSPSTSRAGARRASVSAPAACLEPASPACRSSAPTGRVVAFRTSDAGMVVYDTNGVEDVYRGRSRSRRQRRLRRAAAGLHPRQPAAGRRALHRRRRSPVAVSDDGRWVGYAVPDDAGHLRPVDRPQRADRDRRACRSSGPASSRRTRATWPPSASAPPPALIRADRDSDADGILDEAGAVDVGAVALITLGWPRAWRPTRRCISSWCSAFPLRRWAGRPRSARAGAAAVRLRRRRPRQRLRVAVRPEPVVRRRRRRRERRPRRRRPDQRRRSSSPARIRAGFQTRYLAEGATGAFFSTRIAVANPGSAVSHVLLRYQTDTGQTTSSLLAVPPMARRFVNVGSVPSLGAAVVLDGHRGGRADRRRPDDAVDVGLLRLARRDERGQPVAVLVPGRRRDARRLRPVLPAAEPRARRRRPASRSASCARPARRSSGPTPCRRRAGSPSTSTRCRASRPPTSRRRSAALNAVPIIVERAMYYSRPGQPFAAGHASAGVTAPSTQWFLAEGATGTFFDLFLLLANPSTDPADVRLTYLRPNGAPIVKTRTLAPTSRTTIYVENEDPALLDTPVSTVVESLNARRRRRRTGDVVAGDGRLAGGAQLAGRDRRGGALGLRRRRGRQSAVQHPDLLPDRQHAAASAATRPRDAAVRRRHGAGGQDVHRAGQQPLQRAGRQRVPRGRGQGLRRDRSRASARRRCRSSSSGRCTRTPAASSGRPAPMPWARRFPRPRCSRRGYHRLAGSTVARRLPLTAQSRRRWTNDRDTRAGSGRRIGLARRACSCSPSPAFSS